jgi:selenocysteine lyase/cysteine desulfurase
MSYDQNVAVDTTLETYFSDFRKQIVGIDQEFDTPYGRKKILYADWIASGRMYKPIEDLMMNEIYPFVGNTHTETTVTGCTMTLAYHRAKEIIKEHVNAKDSDILISTNSGMTGVINKFQRILGLKIHERFADRLKLEDHEKPIVFITHMEHHSNQTTWLETIADVRIIEPCGEGLVNLEHFEKLLEEYSDRRIKIAAITSCSNVSGISTPYEEMAKMIHQHKGYCFVDFACSAPYIDIDMHPEDPEARLDAIYFSPHKFLGGPSGTGILIFDQKLYNNRVPDNPGGGTVDWTNPWGEHKYHDAIEAREDGGTPAFLQTMRVALATQLKEEMGTKNILAREHQLIDIVWPEINKNDNLHILAENTKDRLGVLSFYIDQLHYNLAVKILNDRYGIQVRGGCSCAGTYGHYLLHVTAETSKSITDLINQGNLCNKPGWVRLSLHPTMTDAEANYIAKAISELSQKHKEWSGDYDYDASTNEFTHKYFPCDEKDIVDKWFRAS